MFSFIGEFNNDFEKVNDLCMGEKKMAAEVHQCANSSQGNNLLLKTSKDVGNNTNMIVFDGVYSTSNEKEIIEDMSGYLCRLVKDEGENINLCREVKSIPESLFLF
jgi:hypothetical protein